MTGMKANRYLITMISAFWASYFSFAQTRMSREVTYGNYIGNEHFSAIEVDSVQIRTGSYSFISDLKTTIVHGTIEFDELLISGVYNRNLRDGTWNFKFTSGSLDNLSLRRSSNVALIHNLNGDEADYKIRYKQGRLNGESIFTQREILNGRYGNANVLTRINYLNDTIVGRFELHINGVDIIGETDKNGFLNGVLLLKYYVSNYLVVETRKYDQGFLVHLNKTYEESNEDILTIDFDDVVEMLSLVRNSDQKLDYRISESYFGPDFKIGYQQTSPKVQEQSLGNHLLRDHLSLFDSIHSVTSDLPSIQSILKFTRRLEYIYDPDEDSLISILHNRNDSLYELISKVLNKPNLVLRKNSSDTLFHQFQLLKHLKGKCDTMQVFLDKVSTGYFTYQSRDKYYTNGIPGLDRIDTITYEFNGVIKTVPHNIGVTIENSVDLIKQVDNYIEILEDLSAETIAVLFKSLTNYENQEKIDSLDKLVSDFEYRLNASYPEIRDIESIDLTKASYFLKFYNSLNERILKQLKSNYIGNQLSQEEMIMLGSNLICYLSFIDENAKYLSKIDQLQRNWNDSLFTVYRDNPFDFRKLETKVLEGVQNASDILLRHYGTQLLNAKSCEQLEIELEHIVRLTARINYLVENQEMEMVQQLNKVLRRERVVNRIERLLEL